MKGVVALKMTSISSRRLSSATMIKYVLSKETPIKYFDIPDSDVIVPNSSVPFRKIFKLCSKSMTENEFRTLFFNNCKTRKVPLASMRMETSLSQNFENFVIQRSNKKINRITFSSIKRLENGFCYAKLIFSEKCVVIVYFDVISNTFQVYFPVRGNNFNYYIEAPASFTGADTFWIEQQTKEAKIEIKDPREAKSYFFISNELIDEEIKHYATIVEKNEVSRDTRNRDEMTSMALDSIKEYISYNDPYM